MTASPLDTPQEVRTPTQGFAVCLAHAVREPSLRPTLDAGEVADHEEQVDQP